MSSEAGSSGWGLLHINGMKPDILLVARANEHDMGSHALPLLNAWIYLNLISNVILLPCLVMVLFLLPSMTAAAEGRTYHRRNPLIINLIITWILSGIFSLLLFFADAHLPSSPEPNKPLCITQTALLFGIIPMWSVSVAALVYYLVLITSGNLDVGRGMMFAMLAAPYGVEILFSVTNLAFSLAKPDMVTRSRRFFYCALECDALANVMILFTFAVSIVIIALLLYLMVIYRRHYCGLRNAGVQSHPFHLHFHFALRILIFGIYIILGVVVNLMSLFDERSLAPDFYAATIGAVIFLVFGTQADVLWAVRQIFVFVIFCGLHSQPTRSPTPVLPETSLPVSNIDYETHYQRERKRERRLGVYGIPTSPV